MGRHVCLMLTLMLISGCAESEKPKFTQEQLAQIPLPQTTGLPWGTILVNLLGSFVIGVMSGVFDQLVVNGHFKTFLLIGLIGAFTTFSTLMIESVRLFQAGRISLALANLLVSNLLGLTCVLAGFAGVRLLADVLR